MNVICLGLSAVLVFLSLCVASLLLRFVCFHTLCLPALFKANCLCLTQATEALNCIRRELSTSWVKKMHNNNMQSQWMILRLLCFKSSIGTRPFDLITCHVVLTGIYLREREELVFGSWCFHSLSKSQWKTVHRSIMLLFSCYICIYALQSVNWFYSLGWQHEEFLSGILDTCALLPNLFVLKHRCSQTLWTHTQMFSMLCPLNVNLFRGFLVIFFKCYFSNFRNILL